MVYARENDLKVIAARNLHVRIMDTCAKQNSEPCSCGDWTTGVLQQGSLVPGAGFEPAASGPTALQIMSFVPKPGWRSTS